LAPAFLQHMQDQNILVTGRYRLRLVLHRDINDAQVEIVIEAIRQFFHQQ
jgi:hypothetical protein